MFRRFRTALLTIALLFGFYLPSSSEGVILRELTVVALLGTCALLATLAALPAGLAPPIGLVAGISIMAVLTLFSIFSPFTDYSPGVVFIYLALALLYMLNLRGVSKRGVIMAFAAANAASLVLGAAIVSRFEPAHRLLKDYYAAFYPELVPNMLDAFAISKPVLTFGTHSMAGFVVYLLAYLSLLAYRRYGHWLALAATFGHLTLLMLLGFTAMGSTSSTILTAVIVCQILWTLGKQLRVSSVVPVLVVVVPVLAVVATGISVTALLANLQSLVLGDRIGGLLARYSADGLLAENLRYLSLRPFSPIGFTFSESLYFGDSGIAVTLLRGSVPLMLCAYGGLYVFLRNNIADARTARWLWAVTVVFEVGFTPLQYFRFVAALPLLVTYADLMTSSASEASSIDSPPGAVTRAPYLAPLDPPQ